MAVPLRTGDWQHCDIPGPAGRPRPGAGRGLAGLGRARDSDAFIVPVEGGWQPFIELTESRQRWALAKRASMAEAETTTRHFLGSLADALCHAGQSRLSPVEKDVEVMPMRVPDPTAPPAEDGNLELVLSHARSAREASGWELIYSRQRVFR